MKVAITFGIALGVFLFHYWACRRPPKYWYVGGIIPFVWVVLLAVLFSRGMIDWAQDWKVILFPTLIAFLMWIEGHETAKKKEIAQMKAKDIS